MKFDGLRRFAAATIALAALPGCSAMPAASAPEHVAYITSQGSGLTVLDLATFKPVRTVKVGTDPRGLAITPDGRYVLTANGGDAEVAVVDTATFEIVQRIAVGKNVEFMRMAPDGHEAYVTYEPSSTGGPPKPGDTDDDAATPAEIAIIDVGKWTVAARMQAAPETEGLEFSPDGKSLVVANEGDDTLAVYDLAARKQVRTVDISAAGSRPRGVKAAPGGGYVVTLENSDKLLVLDADLKLVKSVATERGPYGVAFDPDGKRVWVAAARAGQLQAFDAQNWNFLASIPVGKRCWHFSFVPGAQQLLLACGRSNDVQLIDTANYKLVQTLEGFTLPWGIVTYPKAAGSLDAP